MSMYVEYWMRQMLYYITYPTLEILFRYVFYHKYIFFFSSWSYGRWYIIRQCQRGNSLCTDESFYFL